MIRLGYEWMYGFYRFHGLVQIFLNTSASKNKKKSVPIREICKIRTSIRIVIFQNGNC
jgi:hypothetical protein